MLRRALPRTKKGIFFSSRSASSVHVLPVSSAITGSGRARGAGWEFVHVCVDDCTRLAYVEVLADERTPSVCGFLERAVAQLGRLGRHLLRPHLLGLEKTYPLVTASTLCGACGEVCPVKIPIPDLLIRLRTESQQLPADPAAALAGAGSGRRAMTVLAFRLWSWLYGNPRLYRVFAHLATRLRALAPARQGAWTDSRAPLVPARRTLQDLLREREAR